MIWQINCGMVNCYLIKGKHEDTLMNFVKPTKAMLYEDKKTLETSLEIIKNSGAKRLYLGHGKPISIETI